MRRKLLLIGIDGLRIDDALRRPPSGSAPPLAPVLSTCASAGTMLTMTMEVPTISGPGWSSLLTGAPHAEHSVSENSFRGHTLHRHLDLLSRAYIADTSRRTFAAASWPPIVDPAGPGPIIASRPDQTRTGQHRGVVRDGETYGYRWADGEIAACARLALREAGPDVSFVSLGETDEAGHLYGGSSAEYAVAVGPVDAHIGRLLAEIEARVARAGAEEEWLVALTTDHGHLDEGGHGGGEAVLSRSFLALRRYGSEDPLPAGTSIHPWEVVSLLLTDLTR
ncbi:hypothetical protein ATY41_08460 [Leifsonia xyli subsp. xyli]|uniref:Phosphodiesterase n=1 Tax=Leifsonia xyli subsp. xyli TaxID=59736 RepID=A0A1E2SM80_LEIXY|nr:hypothetical protein ATY41_08460 [Leifsonia xyli subsp. xyli]